MQNAYLNTAYNFESLHIILTTLEKLPDWPTSLKIEIRDNNINGETLGVIGPDNAAKQYLLVRKDNLYAVNDANLGQLHAPTDLFSAIEQTLTTDTLSVNKGEALERTVQRALLQRAQWKTLPIRSASPAPPPVISAGRPLDPNFAEPKPPKGAVLHSEHIYQSQPQPDGMYRYYILQDGKYYQVKSDRAGWQLIDSRSRFRAYKPYIQRNPEGGWGIDESKGSLLGGMPDSALQKTLQRDNSHDSSDDFQSATSSSEDEYASADDSPPQVFYTAEELADMRRISPYEDNEEHIRTYKRSNNGRYPIRDPEGRPMHIKSIQANSNHSASGIRYEKKLLIPYILWEGYERVARLYDEKIEVVTFKAEYQKHSQESRLIGQKTVITKRVIKKGEILGIYGGEFFNATLEKAQKNPYLIDADPSIFPSRSEAPQLKAIPGNWAFSGDNVLSRINTIFEYRANKPYRQANNGYNTEMAIFDITALNNYAQELALGHRVRLKLAGIFATEDISEGTELRWNYGYSEKMIKGLFRE